jgi:general secretion pathway protein A
MIAQLTCKALARNTQIPLPALLGLESEACGKRGINNRFFYASPLTTQRLALLNNMVGSTSLVIVVIGERGSGKTTLMNRFIHEAGKRWRAGRIRLKRREPERPDELRNLNNRMVFLSHKDTPPSVIVDDAHQLTPEELKLLINSAVTSEGERKLQSIVLFAEPEMRRRFSEMARWLPPNAVIDKIFMAALTEKQTAAYLEHRVRAAGFLKKIPFSEDQIRAIHRISRGLPGWINGEAFVQLRRTCGVDRASILALIRRWRLPAIPRLKWFDRFYAFARN